LGTKKDFSLRRLRTEFSVGAVRMSTILRARKGKTKKNQKKILRHTAGFQNYESLMDFFFFVGCFPLSLFLLFNAGYKPVTHTKDRDHSQSIKQNKPPPPRVGGGFIWVTVSRLAIVRRKVFSRHAPVKNFWKFWIGVGAETLSASPD